MDGDPTPAPMSGPYDSTPSTMDFGRACLALAGMYHIGDDGGESCRWSTGSSIELMPGGYVGISVAGDGKQGAVHLVGRLSRSVDRPFVRRVDPYTQVSEWFFRLDNVGAAVFPSRI